MSLFDQWQRGINLLGYALEAQLCGAKTMAFYEEENRDQRNDINNWREFGQDMQDRLHKEMDKTTQLNKLLDQANRDKRTYMDKCKELNTELTQALKDREMLLGPGYRAGDR